MDKQFVICNDIETAEKLREIQKECNEYLPTTVRGII